MVDNRLQRRDSHFLTWQMWSRTMKTSGLDAGWRCWAVAIQRGRACRNERNHSILGVGVFWGLAAEEGSGAGCRQALRSSCPGRQDAIDEQG